jgi:hypothetical protein
MAGKNNTKRLTVCAMLCALGVVLLLLGSFVEVMDIAMAALASLLCIFAVIEYGGAAPWLVFSVTGVLSLVLLPNKTPAAMYIVFLGYYPIIKEKLERLKKPISWLLKEVIFNLALVVMFFIVKFLLMPNVSDPLWLYVALVVLAQITFILYDIALTRLITFYIIKLRHRFKFMK